MVSHRVLARTALFAALIAGSTAACDTVGFHGASSMRIEVEVYKGPLSKTKDVQEKELNAKFHDSQRAFQVLEEQTEISMCRLGCYRYERTQSQRLNIGQSDLTCQKGDACPAKVVDVWKNFRGDYTHIFEKKRMPDACMAPSGGVESRRPREPKYKVCPLLSALERDISNIRKASSGQITPIDAALYADKLRSRANFWAVEHAAIEPLDSRTRIEMANFAQHAADYGNQIGSRADALLWQDAKSAREGKPVPGFTGIDVAKRLALSLYLRDSDTTDYLNLYDWNKAVFRSRGSQTGLSGTDRVRLVERLVKDTYWSKINTVHASGQGDVRMAFIKDDIGNWNLKAFSADPTELLEAYGEAARSAITAATALAGNPAAAGGALANIGGADRFLSLANRIATGQSGEQATVAGLNVDDLHQRTVNQLKLRQAHYVDEATKLEKRKNDADNTIKGLNGEIEELVAKIEPLKRELTTLESTPSAPTPTETPTQPAQPQTNPNEPRIRELKQEIADLEARKKTKSEERDAKAAEAEKLASDIRNLRDTAVKDIRGILHDHAVVISVLQEAVAPSEEPTSAPVKVPTSPALPVQDPNTDGGG